MEIVTLIFFAGTIFLIVYGILLLVFQKQLAISRRVDVYFDIPEKEEKKKEKKKVVIPAFVTSFFQFMKDKTKVNRNIEQKLAEAGYPYKLSSVEFQAIQLASIVFLGIGSSLLLISLSVNLVTIAMSFLLIFISYRLPLYALDFRKKKRLKQLSKDIPDFFDTINLLIQAGMGLDLAILTVCKKTKGPLSEEFLTTIEDMKLGKTRREAFHALKMRVQLDEFQSIITSLLQADAFGIGMGKMLTSLTVRIREERRQLAREHAFKMPIKILFPMVLFIFPAIFIVILGPFVISFIEKGGF